MPSHSRPQYASQLSQNARRDHVFTQRICEVQIVFQFLFSAAQAPPGQAHQQAHPQTTVQWLRPALLVVGIFGLFQAEVAGAHHPLGGQAPDSLLSGLLSGLGHPVIGIDHLAFVIAAGLLAATQRRGLLLTLGFCTTSLLGTGLHLAAVDVPAPELVIAFSVFFLGIALIRKHPMPWPVMAGLGAIAGIFHGYAYGESIIGAQMTPLVAYLVGFTLIQLVIAGSAYALAHTLCQRSAQHQPVHGLRLAGFTICGIGLTLLSSLILG